MSSRSRPFCSGDGSASSALALPRLISTASSSAGCSIARSPGRPHRNIFPQITVRTRLRHPPHSLGCFPTLWRSDEIGAWGANHARRWTRRMPTAAAGRKMAQNSLFAISACPSASRPPSCWRPVRTWVAQATAPRKVYRMSRACSCALQSGGSSILWVIARVLRSEGWRPSAIASTILGARNASRITRRT